MKRLLVAILSCVMFLSCCFLGGCGGEEGMYKFVKMKVIDYEEDHEYTAYVGDEWSRHHMTMKKDTFILYMSEDNKGYVRFHGIDGGEGEEGEEGWIEIYLFTWMKGYGNEYYAISEGDNQYYGGSEEGVEAFIIEIKGNDACLKYSYYSSSSAFDLEIYLKK